MEELSVILPVAVAEQYFQTGFGIGFCSNIIMPISIVLALTGYCTYRRRVFHGLSCGQFPDLRYGSKFFRIVTAVIKTLAETVTNAYGVFHVWGGVRIFIVKYL